MIVFNSDTGKIRQIDMENSYVYELDPPFACIPGVADIDANYIIDGSVTTRPNMNTALGTRLNNIPITANGIDEAAVVDLPDPCTVTYSGPGFMQKGEVTGGTASFTTDVIGEHKIKVEAWPYLDWEGTFDAI